MSNFGIKILYKIINEEEDFLCDRAYAPMKDMEGLIRKSQIPLWAWESKKPLYEFDLLGFSLSYELTYTNVLNILELSQIKIISQERKDIFPLVFGGGPAVFNPEPMADFMDFFIIGDGEEAIPEVLNVIKEFKKLGNTDKEELLLKLAEIKGIYVPRFYIPDPDKNYLPKRISNNVPEKITKRIVDLTIKNQPVSEIVPYLSSIQDRQVLEIRRGCDRGCRFCQVGYTYLPIRERTPENIIELSKKALQNTGYDEYSLLSLSASDYSCLHEVSHELNSQHAQKGISLSMPSQRADRFNIEIAKELNIVRKTGITLAPEAGTNRLREVINKGLEEKDIKNAIESVYEEGFQHVKLYFMIGLPTETYDDLDGIISILRWASDLSRVKKQKKLNITCTISTFVPKPFTPFQWFSQNNTKEFEEKIKYLKQKIKYYRLWNVKLNFTNPNTALLEAVMSRGDRRVSKLILEAFKQGAKFDSWEDLLNIDLWKNAAKDINLNLEHEATKHRDLNDTNPWEIIDTGILKKFLQEEYNKAINITETKACTENTCHSCGICFNLNVFNTVTINKSKNNKYVKEIRALSDEQQATSDKQQATRSWFPIKTVQKVELIHSKNSDFRFISHLDLQKLFERAARRAELPISFTEGFNPRPKLRWIMPLPIFYESNYEIAHLELSNYVKDADLQIRLNNELPPEIQLKSVHSIDFKAKFNDLENIKVVYRILTCDPTLWEEYVCETKSRLENFLEKDSLVLKVFKKNENHQVIDVRSKVENLKVLNTNPLELELKIIGITRPEIVINQIAPKKFYVDEKYLSQKWQLVWKVTKEMITLN